MQFIAKVDKTQIDKIFREIRQNKEFGIRSGMYKVGEKTKTILQSSFTPPSQAKGRLYTSFKKKKFAPPHRASAPGQAPAVWTGKLNRSITVGKVIQAVKRWKLSVFTNILYAKILEFGGINSEGWYVEPRPMWRKVVNKVKMFAGEIISLEVGKALHMKGSFTTFTKTTMPWHS